VSFGLKFKCALAAAGGVAASLGIMLASVANGPDRGITAIAGPLVVELQPGSVRYHAAGDFSRNGRPASPPKTTVSIRQPLVIMKYQVTAAEYQRCVEGHACSPLDPGTTPASDRPAVKISWRDANSYADWLSARTGALYRLPTDEEWAYAAASRFQDEALPDVDGGDPAQLWLARYEMESSREGLIEKEPRSIGSYGANENGLIDLAGNVWEWTSTCFVRQAIDANGQPIGTATTNCGVRVAEGRHRAYVPEFVRDVRSGGCMTGAPPANLGFRLVRDGSRDRLRSLVESVQGFLSSVLVL